MEPKFVTRPAFTIVGMAYCGKNENEEIPQLWQEFTPRGPEIRARRETGHAYGVIYGFDDESGVMDYLAGIEVAEAGDLPQGMIALDLPHKTYAVFECTLPTLMQTMGQIYGTWLPDSGYRRAEGPEFEFYDERFDPAREDSVNSVFIPVKKG